MLGIVSGFIYDFYKDNRIFEYLIIEWYKSFQTRNS